MIFISKSCIIISIITLILLCWFMELVTIKLNPEISMYLESTCDDKTLVWDGNLLGLQISNGRRLSMPGIIDESPKILVGSHHKTGTYLAKKLFSVICARLKICCIFLVSHSDPEEVSQALQHRSDVFGHWMWSWFPEEIASNYRFVHFYRQPINKIASGYRYHEDGVESWSKSTTHGYSDTCNFDNDELYCEGAKLCTECCYRARYSWKGRNASSPLHSPPPSMSAILNRVNSRQIKLIDDLLCSTLGQIHDTSIQSTLLSSSLSDGVKVEGALDIYENLLMSVIVNHTWNDRNSINIDLDAIMASPDSFKTITRQLVRFVDVKHQLGPTEIQYILNDLQFYDLNNSPLYRYYMESPIMNHASPGRYNSTEVKMAVVDLLNHDEVFREAYRPILMLMGKAGEEANKKIGVDPYVRRLIDN